MLTLSAWSYEFRMTTPARNGAPAPRILIVHDNSASLAALLQALNGTGFKIRIALDSATGYDRAIAMNPDLILLEIDLKPPNGLALARMLNANPATTGIPIIFVSGNQDVDTRLAALRECGGVDYIAKPFSGDELVERMRIHLRLSLRKPRGPIEPDASNPPMRHNVLVEAVKQYLSHRLSDDFQLDEIAAAFHVGKRYLANNFKRSTGATVFEYIRDQRMLVAKQLLKDTSLSIASIANEVGFQNATNFSTAFRKHVGEAPTTFRERSRRPHIV